MGDTLNSLLAANRSSSVLQGIMNPAQVNPLAAMTSAGQTAGTIFDLRQKQATQAAGEAYQGAIDPTTGEFDPNKFRINLQAAGPVAAMAAGPALANTQSISSDQLNQMRAKAGWANTAAGSLTRLGPNITQADAIGTLHEGVTQGILTQPEFERQVAELATLGNDPAKLHAWASQHQFNAMNTQQQLEQTYGTTGSQTGPSGATIGVTQAPASQGGGISTQPQQGAPQGLSAAQAGQPIDYVDDQGVTQHTTLGEFHKKLGIGVPPVGTPPPSAPVPGSQPPAAAKSIPGPEPGMAEKWKASADQYKAANDVAASYQQRIFPLVQAASILKSGDVTTGQGAEAFNHVKSFLMTQATNLGLDTQTIQQADFDKTAKYLQQYVNQQGMSGRSDQALASAISGNPSAHISTLANQQILPAMLGMERMRQSIITDFKAQNGQPKNFSDYAAVWQNKHDPRAFFFDQLDKDQRANIPASLTTPAQRKAFSDPLDIVDRNPGIMGQATMPGH